MHNEMLLIEDEKMSKSLGNFVTARFLLDLGVKGDAIRLVLLGTHYRKPLNWTEVKAFDALQTLRSWHSLTDASVGSEPDSRVLEALSDDLNTAEAIAVMHDLASTRQFDRLLASAQLMGLLRDDGEDWRQVLIPSSVAVRIRGISDRRINARQAKDYETADQIRQMLESIGLSVQDFAGATKVSASGFSVAPTLSDDERRSLNVSSQAENLTSTQLERFFYELLPGRVAVLEQQLGL
jgi:cysteinyl-tRNA synthetase